jgi:serine/threonine protein kinase
VAFGSYVVRELIGRGGMAAVYRAEHLLLEKPVALKVMDHALVLNAAARQRFLLEGRVAAAIKHPNIVDITDVGMHEGVPYLVMELLKGEDLEAHLRQRTVLDDRSAIRLALPVIAALHVAHRSGVVHRDIKPSNIFMSVGPDQQLVPKVLDFGISKVSFEDSTFERVTTPRYQLIGTPRYLPPEALRGACELGPLADQYSLGVVLYQCVTGCTPFGGDTLVSLLNSLSRGAFEPARSLQPTVSPALDRVITRALSAEPSDRFPTIRDMGCALLELAAERTQVVWGQSFRSLTSPQIVTPIPRLDEPWPSSTGLPSPITERLSSDLSRGSTRFRRFGLGLALVAFGALASGLWSSLAPFHEASSPSAAPSRAPSADRPPVLAARPVPSGQTGAARVALGLTPLPADVGRSQRQGLAAVPTGGSTQPRVRAHARRTSVAARRNDPVSAVPASLGQEGRRPADLGEDNPPPTSTTTATTPATAGEDASSTVPADTPRPALANEPTSVQRFGPNQSPLLD